MSQSEKNFGAAVGRHVIVFAVVQLVFLLGVGGFAAWRYQELTQPNLPPVPRNEPIRIAPLYDRPEVVSDEQLQRVLSLLEPRFRGRNPQINHVDHALRFWGVEAVFSDPRSLSGIEMRELLLDHRRFAAAWGDKKKPFLVPDTTGDGLTFRTMEGKASASHVDHTLAGLAEVGTPLDFPVITPNGETKLRAGLAQSLDEFSLNQVEYEWSTLAYLHYLPHARSFRTTEGQEITWDRLADRLMRQRLAQGVCFGNHRLHALALMLQADEEFEMLSEEGRASVIAHLQDVTRRLVKTQSPEGYWDGSWPGEEIDGPQPEGISSPMGAQADRLLATGHALEWWAFAPPECLPPADVVERAGQWLVHGVEELTPSQLNRFYPFLTHVGRALSLWRGRFPAEVYRP